MLIECTLKQNGLTAKVENKFFELLVHKLVPPFDTDINITLIYRKLSITITLTITAIKENVKFMSNSTQIQIFTNLGQTKVH
jgi:hypothetical protein